MAISSSLLEILACPYCVTHPDASSDSSGKGSFEVIGSKDAPTALKCKQCHRQYGFSEDGLANLLIEEATISNA